jgi:hypothetical protein
MELDPGRRRGEGGGGRRREEGGWREGGGAKELDPVRRKHKKSTVSRMVSALFQRSSVGSGKRREDG